LRILTNPIYHFFREVDRNWTTSPFPVVLKYSVNHVRVEAKETIVLAMRSFVTGDETRRTGRHQSRRRAIAKWRSGFLFLVFWKSRDEIGHRYYRDFAALARLN